MLRIVYSSKSKPSAMKIAQEDRDINISRSYDGEINWGRARARTVLNPDTSNATNKRVMRELFAKHGVPTPRLYSVDELEEIFDTVSWASRRFVGRPDNHMKGRGFWRVYDHDTLYKALNGTRRKEAATHFMEFIDAPHELRIHIFLGKSIRISEKLHTKFHEYTTIKPTIPVEQARQAAKQAVEALGLDFGTVDILAEDDGTPYVLEVNTAPGLGGSMPRVYAETFSKWYRGEWEA